MLEGRNGDVVDRMSDPEPRLLPGERARSDQE